jgi:hypothetical protein
MLASSLLRAIGPCGRRPVRPQPEPNGWPSGTQLRELSLKAMQLVGVGRKTRVYWFRAMSLKWREGPTIAALPLALRELRLAPGPPMH